MTFITELFRIVWHLLCVLMLTAFLGLVAVHNDYYAEGSGSDDLLHRPLAIGGVLALMVITVHAVRWRRRVLQKSLEE